MTAPTIAEQFANAFAAGFLGQDAADELTALAFHSSRADGLTAGAGIRPAGESATPRPPAGNGTP